MKSAMSKWKWKTEMSGVSNSANTTSRLCTFLAHTMRSLVWFSIGWNNLWVFVDFLCLLLYLSVHIYGRYIYSIVTLVNTHSLKFTPGVYHCGVFATIPTLHFNGVPTQLLGVNASLVFSHCASCLCKLQVL
jgi:hypothetical protein